MASRRLDLSRLEARTVPANGLSATYFDNDDLSGPTVARVDPVVDFDWAIYSPAPQIGNDTFSARWTGRVQATVPGAYTFRTHSDDGVRLWVNGAAVVDHWDDHGLTYDAGSVTLAAGQLASVRLEYYERYGNAGIKLEWQPPGAAGFVTVPTDRLFTDAPNAAPTGVALSPATVAANQPAGTAVGTLTTADPDPGDPHAYALVAGAGGADNAKFQVSGDHLVTAASFPAPAVYAVRVRTTDAGGLSAEQAFSVTVTGPATVPTGGPLDVIDTGHDVIPDFGTHPTVSAVRSGKWSDPRTWSTGKVPGFGAVVAVGANRVVTYDFSYPTSATALTTVSVRAGGTLAFRTDVSTRLVVSNLQVLEGGTLTVGTAAKPVAAKVTAEIVIADRPLDLATDPDQFGNGVTVFGTVKVFGAAKQVNGVDTGYVKLASAPAAGATALKLAGTVTGWRAGDALVLPDTRQLDWGNDPYPARQTETATVRSVSADGKTVTLTAPLAFGHAGAITSDGQLLLGHVGNVTRNVVIRSENPLGTYTPADGLARSSRGHTFTTDRADVDVRYAEYRDMGRTTNDALNTTTNLKGRYAVHVHHLHGPESGQANGRQFTFSGDSLNAGASPHKWPMAIHDSHDGLVQGLTVAGGTGAGIVTEDGSESHNLFQGNFVVGITGDRYAREKFRTDVGADGFWMAGPNNELRDNVVAAVARSGYVVYGGDNADPLTVHVPAFPGADSHEDSEHVDMGGMPIRAFVNNEAYSCLKGIETWYIGNKNYYDAYDQPVGESVIQGGRFWHIFRHVFEGNQQNHLTIDGMVAVGDPNQLGVYDNPVGLEFRQSQQVVVRNVRVENFKVGLIAPAKTGRLDPNGLTKVEDVIPTRIQNSYFRNKADIVVPPASIDAYRDFPPSVTVIENCVTAGDETVVRTYREGRFSNVVQISRVYVLSQNGNPTANYQLYAAQQAADFVVPVSTGDFEGAPVAGLTNAELWASDLRTRWGYRYAVFGDVLPAGAFALPGVGGLARNLTAAEAAALHG